MLRVTVSTSLHRAPSAQPPQARPKPYCRGVQAMMKSRPASTPDTRSRSRLQDRGQMRSAARSQHPLGRSRLLRGGPQSVDDDVGRASALTASRHPAGVWTAARSRVANISGRDLVGSSQSHVCTSSVCTQVHRRPEPTSATSVFCAHEPV